MEKGCLGEYHTVSTRPPDRPPTSINELIASLYKLDIKRFHANGSYTRQENAKYRILLQMFKLTVPNLDMHA